jgi:RES domain-containing protein
VSTKGITPPNWTLAQDLAAKGAAAIIVPSVVAARSTLNEFNAVFWKWSAARPHQVRVTDNHARLPRPASSWQ